MNQAAHKHGGNWVHLLVEPMKVLGAYQGKAPSLDSFALHAIRIGFDSVSVAGQFMELPARPPESWRYGDIYRAYATFEFIAIRNFRSNGLPRPQDADDSLHGVQVGSVGKCTLSKTDSVFMELPNQIEKKYWKSFWFEHDDFHMELEAGQVLMVCGKQALG